VGDATLNTIDAVAMRMSRGAVTSRALTEAVLESIAEDATAFTRVDPAAARAAADASDAVRAQGRVPSLLAGIPMSVKDLFDVAGEPTPAGSAILRDAPPASHDAPVVARLRAAGAVIVGRTHMSEFAFSGLGTNPHLPQLTNPRDASRVPGGSSSGAAVAVARGQSVFSLGTDTGGSVRIPAAFCGVTGFKPTQRRITRAGAFPLAESLDSIGPLANSVACCRIADRILADTPAQPHAPVDIRQVRFAIPTHVVLHDIDDVVGAAFERALGALRDAGATIAHIPFPEFTRIGEINARGTMVNAESFGIHQRAGLLTQRERYDPNVRARIEIGERMTPADYAALLSARTQLIRDADVRSAGYDALVFPAVAWIAPRFTDVADASGWSRANGIALRNASLVNMLDRCAVSLPMQRGGELPSGLMIVGETLGDARLLAVAEAVEHVVTRGRSRP
jgi:aspartyl-tRNA(Asn)/glutamyl-tRNA(Gln) amidotransferase subunit A